MFAELAGDKLFNKSPLEDVLVQKNMFIRFISVFFLNKWQKFSEFRNYFGF